MSLPVVELEVPTQREFAISRKHLNIPIDESGKLRRTDLLVDGKLIRRLNIKFADDGSGDHWMFYDVSEFKGMSLTFEVECLPEGSLGLSSITQNDTFKDAAQIYHESLRPSFHFTTRRGWINDPNGLVFFNGEYHLFYQHNPLSAGWENMHWGHAVSSDLFHWEELPIALSPGICPSGDPYTVYSGSAVVDWRNTSGFQTGSEPAIVAIYTAAGSPYEQNAVYSNDRGRTWTQYAGNPVIPHIVGENRDPKVTWDRASKLWVLVLYLDKNDFGLFTSPDLKHWTRLDGVINIGNDIECPDFFQINLDNCPNKPMWVFISGCGRYVTGSFDGRKFSYFGTGLTVEYGHSFSDQTFSDIPGSDGRRIQISMFLDRFGEWFHCEFPNMPFNHQMCIRCALSLRSTPDGPRLYKYPVKEIETLYDRSLSLKNLAVNPGENPLSGLAGDALDIDAEIEVGSASEIDFSFRGVMVKYVVAQSMLQCPAGCAPLAAVKGKVKLRLIVDRASVEVYGNDGQVAIASTLIPVPGEPDAVLSVTGGTAHIVALNAHTLKSIWH